jgi:hypothetical protein
MSLTFDRIIGILGVILALAGFGVAFALDAETEGEYRAAIMFFISSAACFVSTVGYWYLTTEAGETTRLLISTLVLALVLSGLFQAIRWTRTRHKMYESESAEAVQPTITASEPNAASVPLHPKPLPHPIIEVTTTFVKYQPETRLLTIVLRFENLTPYGVEAKIHAHMLWDGPHFPGESDMPKDTAIDRVIAMGPSPYNLSVALSCILPAEQASQWVNEKALISADAAVTYADQDAATEYEFAGDVRLKQNFVDVVTSRWFTRPKEAAMF